MTEFEPKLLDDYSSQYTCSIAWFKVGVPPAAHSHQKFGLGVPGCYLTNVILFNFCKSKASHVFRTESEKAHRLAGMRAGFVYDRKFERKIEATAFKATQIPNGDVTLPSQPDEPASVRSRVFVQRTSALQYQWYIHCWPRVRWCTFWWQIVRQSKIFRRYQLKLACIRRVTFQFIFYGHSDTCVCSNSFEILIICPKCLLSSDCCGVLHSAMDCWNHSGPKPMSTQKRNLGQSKITNWSVL